MWDLATCTVKDAAENVLIRFPWEPGIPGEGVNYGKVCHPQALGPRSVYGPWVLVLVLIRHCVESLKWTHSGFPSIQE